MLRALYETLPPSLTSLVKSAYRGARDINYRREIYPRTYRVDSATFRSYEPIGPPSDALLDQLIGRVSPGDTVYDVGAHVGTYSLILAAKGCDVYAFEPNPVVFDKLALNVRANEFELSPFNVGISDEDGESRFYLASPSDRSSFNEYNAQFGTSRIVDTLDVEVTTVDKLVAEDGLRPPDHLKIDVEGFGLEVLKGAEQTITDHGPTVYFEPHETSDSEYRTSELRSLFDDFDYEVRRYGRSWVCLPKAADRKSTSTS